MTLWLVRCGADGSYEQMALSQSIVGIGWSALGDCASYADRDALKAHYEATYTEESSNQVRTNLSQVYAFVSRIQIGDLVALP